MWQTIVANAPNILLALSNIACAPVVTNLRHERKLQQSLSVHLLELTAWTSFISHLLQSHKRNQVGFGCPKLYSQILNGADVLACGLLGASILASLARANPAKRAKVCKLLVMPTLCVIALNWSAERASSTRVFVTVHAFWHVAAYYFAGAWISHLENI